MGRKRGILINATKLINLRDQEGWSQEDLGKLAGLSMEAIWKAENDKGIDPSTVRKICNVTAKYGLTYERLVEEEYVFTFPDDVAMLSEAEQARRYRQMFDAAGAEGEARIMKKQKGSFKVTFRMCLEDAAKLEAAFREGRLDACEVLRIDVADETSDEVSGDNEVIPEASSPLGETPPVFKTNESPQTPPKELWIRCPSCGMKVSYRERRCKMCLARW